MAVTDNVWLFIHSFFEKVTNPIHTPRGQVRISFSSGSAAQNSDSNELKWKTNSAHNISTRRNVHIVRGDLLIGTVTEGAPKGGNFTGPSGKETLHSMHAVSTDSFNWTGVLALPNHQLITVSVLVIKGVSHFKEIEFFLKNFYSQTFAIQEVPPDIHPEMSQKYGENFIVQFETKRGWHYTKTQFTPSEFNTLSADEIRMQPGILALIHTGKCELSQVVWLALMVCASWFKVF